MHSAYEAVIGLEIHAQLKTASKAFCACPTTFGAQPNVNVCPICLGHPGTLPVLNDNLVFFAVKMGLATSSSIRERSSFSRKNYFYPDLPKGYQISQYADPICYDGHVEIETNDGVKTIGITRIHMEEDSGKSIHDLDIDTLVDLNRSGVPLIEIVSEPDLRSAHEAYQYLMHVRQILVYLNICDGNLEEGSLRCDANVSIRPIGQKHLGTKTEVKNLNSFRNVEKAIAYEIQRQIELVESGGTVRQVTCMWDAAAQATRVMRTKEMAHDYRYFPEPDLTHVVVEQEWLDAILATLPELGLAKKRRFMAQYGLPAYDASILADETSVADYYEEACAAVPGLDHEAAKQVSNWIMTELLRIMGDRKCGIRDTACTPDQLASLVEAVAGGKISNKVAKDIFPELIASGELASDVIKKKGLTQNSDAGALEEMVRTVIQTNPDNLRKYKDGKTTLLGFFVGQVLKASGGTANPSMVSALMQSALDAHE